MLFMSTLKALSFLLGLLSLASEDSEMFTMATLAQAMIVFTFWHKLLQQKS